MVVPSAISDNPYNNHPTLDLRLPYLLLLPVLCALPTKMSKFSKQVVTSDHAMKSALFSQAIVSGGTVYVSGNIGIVQSTLQVVEGSVSDRTVFNEGLI